MNKPWFKRDWVIVLAVIFLEPIGLIWMWAFSSWSTSTKKIITGLLIWPLAAWWVVRDASRPQWQKVLAIVAAILWVGTGVVSATVQSSNKTNEETASISKSTPKAQVSVPTVKPSQTTKPEPTPNPVQPTSTIKAAVTASQVPAAQLILDVPGLLGKPATEVTKPFGDVVRSTKMSAGSFAWLPNGGEVRYYKYDKYLFSLDVDNGGITRRFQLDEGLAEEGYSLNDWAKLLPRFGLAITQQPDVNAPAAKRWTNFNGLEIEIASEDLSGKITSIVARPPK